LRPDGDLSDIVHRTGVADRLAERRIHTERNSEFLRVVANPLDVGAGDFIFVAAARVKVAIVSR
jgi:hypothetical protein